MFPFVQNMVYWRVTTFFSLQQKFFFSESVPQNPRIYFTYAPFAHRGVVRHGLGHHGRKNKKSYWSEKIVLDTHPSPIWSYWSYLKYPKNYFLSTFFSFHGKKNGKKKKVRVSRFFVSKWRKLKSGHKRFFEMF